MMRFSVEAEWWARQYNVEAAACQIPDVQQVLDGVFHVSALGNDGMGATIILSMDEQARCDPDAGAEVQMVWLGKALTAVRREEIRGRER